MVPGGQDPPKAGATKVHIIVICKMYDVDISEPEGLRSYVIGFIMHLNVWLYSLLLSGF